MEQQSDAIAVFCCYAREDGGLFNELQTHLSPLQRRNVITISNERDITPGKVWKQEIKQHLDKARMILLLISPNFIHSDGCCSIEIPYAMARHKQGKARVIPILLRPVSSWEKIPPGDIQLGQLQVLPKDAQPVTSLADQDRVWKEVVEGIEGAANELLRESPQLLSDHSSPPLTSEEQSLTLEESKDPITSESLFFPPHLTSSHENSSDEKDFFKMAIGLIQKALEDIEAAEEPFKPSSKLSAGSHATRRINASKSRMSASACSRFYFLMRILPTGVKPWSDLAKRRRALEYLEKVPLPLNQLGAFLEQTSSLPEEVANKRHILRNQIYRITEQIHTLLGWIDTSISACQSISEQFALIKQAFAGLSVLKGGDDTH